MLHASTQALILKLCEMTATGEIAWRRADDECSVFETEGYLVEVREDPPRVRVLTADGRELERASASELDQAPVSEGGVPLSDEVMRMAAFARRTSIGPATVAPKIVIEPAVSESAKPVERRFTRDGFETEAAWASAMADMALQQMHDPQYETRAPAATPAPAREPSPALLISGIHAVSHQTATERVVTRREPIAATPIGDLFVEPEGRDPVPADAYKPWR